MGHERSADSERLVLAQAPIANEIGGAAVAAGVAVGLDLRKQRLGRAPVLLVAVGIGLERQFHRHMKRARLACSGGTLVCRHRRLIRLLELLPERVTRQASVLGDGVQRHLSAHVHAPYLA